MVKSSQFLLSAIRISPLIVLIISTISRNFVEVEAYPKTTPSEVGHEFLIKNQSPDQLIPYNYQRASESTSTTANAKPSSAASSFPTTLDPEDLEPLTASVRGLRVEDVSKGVSYEHNGVSVLLAEASAVIRLFGDRFTKDTVIRFVTEDGIRGTDCDDLTSTKSFAVSTFG